ncbi:TetR family transcriptional regulator [Actinocorallia herbida]|uniref:TetR family transcriptional regulator n=1 Tax=Actinocorallia herbida TaxID=58109 RepID=A0A3N1CXK6_9ACTN|nr:TetR/AcrR family transcriptional regulator [Actinocorallia herbida]ROO85976.1 TetR family transcriptional regulator [Actinocorallia herbida]
MSGSSGDRAGPSTRDRLLDAAGELFYREGVGVGVEALCRAAGVSKRSMYQLFDGKDEVIAASLARRAPDHRRALLPVAEGPPRERILHVFQRLEELSAEPEFRGCPFVAAAVELKDPAHPASTVARTAKNALTAFFRTEAGRAGAPDPDLLARQLTLAFDGANSTAVIQAAPLDGLATATATALLQAAGL